MTDYFLLTGHLTPKQRGVWLALRCHIWQHGRLPPNPVHLAGVAGLHPRAWHAMEPVLQPLFDQDEAGAWHDFELEEERAAVLAKRARLAKSGAAGAEGRWKPRLVDGQNAMANAMANAIDEDAENGGLELAGAMAVGASPLASHGPTVGLKSLNPEDKFEDTDGRTDGRATTDAIGQPASDAVRNALSASGNGVQNGSDVVASAIAPAMADAMAAAIADANGKTPDGEIIAALRKIGSGKIQPSLLTPSGIEPIRALMAEGCSFQRDIVPALQGVLPGLTEQLRSLKAKFIREASIANRDLAAKEACLVTAQAGRFFAAVDTPEWRAWHDDARRNGRKSFPQIAHGTQKGWWFDTQWPPGIDPASYLKPAQAAE